MTQGDWVVAGVALIVWGLVFFYLTRLDRRIKELEKR
jgi:CcmD family protein